MDLIERAAEHIAKANTRQEGLSEAPGIRHTEPVGDTFVLDNFPSQLDEQIDLTDTQSLPPGEIKSGRPPLPRRSERTEAPARALGSEKTRRVDLDFSTFEKNNILLPFGKSTQLTEEFRHIKRDVLTLRNVDGLENSNMVMVTSAAPGEGKTHTAINLAMSIASERDLTALLIDTDFTRPMVLERLGISAERGLIDLLDDPSLDVSDVILRTNVETLAIIPAGAKHQRSTELLSSRRMHEISEEISKRYGDRVVIFDTAPLLATSEPAVLIKHVGQILVVVEADRTPKGALSSAVDIIKDHQGIGFVLNKVRPQLGDSLVGGYHNYYSYGYSKEDH